MKISLFGGTGFAGGHIATEAVKRGHTVIAYARNAPTAPVDGVEYRTGSVLDPATREDALKADVVISAVAPRGDMEDTLRGALAELADEAAASGVRLGVIGGAGSLLVSPGGPRLFDTPDFPEDFKPEAKAAAGVLEDLLARDDQLDWFYLSPPAGFGAWAQVESRGSYRTGDDVLLVDADGQSQISGEDFALAMLDEIENKAHSRQRFTVAH